MYGFVNYEVGGGGANRRSMSNNFLNTGDLYLLRGRIYSFKWLYFVFILNAL